MKPSAPTTPPNAFQKLLGIPSNTHYSPNQRQFYFTMHLKVKRQWREGFANKRSQDFIRLASEVIPEIQLTIDLGTALMFSLVHVGKYKLSSKLKLIFVVESIVSFDSKEFQKILNRIIKKDGVIGERLRVVLNSVMMQKCDSVEFEHLKAHGANPCSLCGENQLIHFNIEKNNFFPFINAEKILRDHRGINVNNRSNLVDMCAFTNTLTGIGLIIAVALLLA
jgi:hypothetical protein